MHCLLVRSFFYKDIFNMQGDNKSQTIYLPVLCGQEITHRQND
jgi:hypothetical protein